MRYQNAALALVCVALGGCGPAPKARPNLLLITVDTLRADHLGCYGYRRDTSPRIDALAREGTRFATAITAAPVTLTSHASILTSTYPSAHGLLGNQHYLIEGARLTTAAEILRPLGYRTGAFVSASILSHRYGLADGFDIYEDSFDLQAGAARRRGRQTVDLALAWLRRAKGGPFFLWLHLFDPHGEYDPPEPYRSLVLPKRRAKHQSAREPSKQMLYDGEIRYADAQVGRMLDHLQASGMAPRTLVILTADHGQGLGQHGIEGHIRSLFDEVARVPLILRCPGRVPAGKVVGGQVRTIDILPTALELMGVERRVQFDGRSLAPLLQGHAAPTEVQRTAYVQTWLYGVDQRLKAGENGLYHPRALRTERWKLIDDKTHGGVQLYDLSSDPHEQTNLAARQTQVVSQLQQQLTHLLSRARPVPEAAELTPTEKAKLRALGYLN
jgi:arylsulfatase A-like enzyme